MMLNVLLCLCFRNVVYNISVDLMEEQSVSRPTVGLLYIIRY